MKPKIIATAAVSIDGRIARSAEHASTWTSKADKVFLRGILERADVIVVGARTYSISPPLQKRHCIVFTRGIPDKKTEGNTCTFFNPEGPTPVSALLAPYRTVVVQGGTQVYSYFLEADLIDSLYITIEPVVFGRGIPFVNLSTDLLNKFVLISADRLNTGGALLLHYRRDVRSSIDGPGQAAGTDISSLNYA